MPGHDTAPTRQHGGLPDKRRAIMRGALSVFARDGYTRASIDAISVEAGVSTRTIYKHFADKAQLFQAVIQESATRAAKAQIAIIDRHLNKIIDIEKDLIEFGVDFAVPPAGYAEHFALVRQINAEAGHISPAAIDAWLETGPLRVRQELAQRLQQIQDRGLLHIENPARAAVHLMNLVSVVNPSHHGSIPPEEEIVDIVTAGVRVFLYGYLK
ncbi:MAG TPA: TetR/AcrR family transcriptional regulator [Pseudonocardiaceae bacterium]